MLLFATHELLIYMPVCAKTVYLCSSQKLNLNDPLSSAKYIKKTLNYTH